VVRIFDALNTKLKSAFLPRLLATAAEQRSVDRAVFIPTEFHGNAPVWVVLIAALLAGMVVATAAALFSTAIQNSASRCGFPRA
jgi:hypothetical protein